MKHFQQMGEILLNRGVCLALIKSCLPASYFFYIVTTKIHFKNFKIEAVSFFCHFVASLSLPLLSIIISSN